MATIRDSLEINEELRDAMTCLFESSIAGNDDFCGEQRDWHLPRLRRAARILIALFPCHAGPAMDNAKTPYDN